MAVFLLMVVLPCIVTGATEPGPDDYLVQCSKSLCRNFVQCECREEHDFCLHKDEFGRNRTCWVKNCPIDTFAQILTVEEMKNRSIKDENCVVCVPCPGGTIMSESRDSCLERKCIPAGGSVSKPASTATSYTPTKAAPKETSTLTSPRDESTEDTSTNGTTESIAEGSSRSSFNYNSTARTCTLFSRAGGCMVDVQQSDCGYYVFQIEPPATSIEQKVADTIPAKAEDVQFDIVRINEEKTSPGYVNCDPGCLAFVNKSYFASEFAANHTPIELTYLIEVLHTDPPYPTQSLYGWIIIQQRLSEELDYDRLWEDYKMGFGSVTSPYSNFWMGLESMHQLTTFAATGGSADFMLRFEIRSKTNLQWYYAEYSLFWLESETRKYIIHFSGYSGNTGDALNKDVANSIYKINGRPFTTRDRHNDASSGNCAVTSRFGWWFNNCEGGTTTGSYGSRYRWASLNTFQSGAGNMLSASRVMIRKNY